MKKIISTLLCACFVFSLTACKKEETTTAAPTYTPTQTQSEDDTDASTTEPEVRQESFVKNYDLESIYFEYLKDQTAYGARNTQDEQDRTSYVFLDADLLFLFDEGYDALLLAIDTYQEGRVSELSVAYDDAVSAFQEAEEAEENLTSTHLEERMRVFRSDADFFSFADLSAIDDDGRITTFNYRSKTAELISLDDVITSRDALAEYVADVFLASGNEEYTSNIVQIVSWIEKGELPFVLTYDGIIVPVCRSEWGNYYDESDEHIHYTYLKIPAAGSSDVFNMEYFENVPETFVLQMDPDGNLTWDFDEDGFMDTMTVSYTSPEDDDYIETLTIRINDYEFAMSNIEGYLDCAYVVKNAGHYSLHLTCNGLGGLWKETSVFYLENIDSILFTGSYTGWLDHDEAWCALPPTYLPKQAIPLYNHNVLPGDFFGMFEYDYLSDLGVIYPEVEPVRYYGFVPTLTSQKTLTGMRLSSADGEPLDEIKLPADTTFALVGCSGFSGDELFITLQVLDENEEDVYVRLDATFEDYQVLIDGENIRDLFYYILMGD